MSWQEEYKSKLVSFEEAAAVIKSGDLIIMGAGPNAPVDLVEALCKRYQELKDVRIISGLSMYPFDFMKGEYKGHIKSQSVFMSPVDRYFSPQGNVEYIPCHFSAMNYVITIHQPDVWMVEVSTPDERGYMSYGPIGGFIGERTRQLAAATIVQVNKKIPYIYGVHGHIHVSQVDYICEKDHDLPQIPHIAVEQVHREIAAHIVDRIPDGATIQLGLGTIANAIGFSLDGKKDLGVHTEMFTNSMMDLVKSGVVNCSRKTFRPGKATFCFSIGSTELYEFVDHNILLENMPITMINDISTIAQNDNFISINNAIMVDLTGQVCSETVGFRMISGTGGQADFVRGSRLSRGGMSFIALESTEKTPNGTISKICTVLPHGAIVTTPRTDVQYVVTEYGVADLYSKSISQRVEALISIAHPDFRDQLRHEAAKAGYLT